MEVSGAQLRDCQVPTADVAARPAVDVPEEDIGPGLDEELHDTHLASGIITGLRAARLARFVQVMAVPWTV